MAPKSVKHSIPLILLLLSACFSCADDPSTPEPDIPTELHLVRDIDIIENVYFLLDHPNVVQDLDEGSVELFQSVTPEELQMDPDLPRMWGRAWVDTLGDGSDIRAALQALANGQAVPPFQETHFKLLQLDDDYRFVLSPSPYELVIGVELREPLEESRVLAARYVNASGDTTGNLGTWPPDTLALELIGPSDPLPDNQFGYAWAYELRNGYRTGFVIIDPAYFELDIVDETGSSTPEGSDVPWLRIFGLDRTDETGTGPPDGRVDLRSGLVDFMRGTVTFPILTPFNPPDDSVAVWTAGEFAFAGPYADLRLPRLYTDYLTEQELLSMSRYTLRIRSRIW